MIDDDELFKYFPEVELAIIQDTTPKALARASSGSTSGADLEPLFNPEVIMGEDGIAHALSQEIVHSEVPDFDNLLTGISMYVDEMYSDNVGFDGTDAVSLESYRDGTARLEVDLHYEPDADFVSDVDLPGSLTVSGEVRDEYQDELDEYNPSGRF